MLDKRGAEAVGFVDGAGFAVAEENYAKGKRSSASFSFPVSALLSSCDSGFPKIWEAKADNRNRVDYRSVGEEFGKSHRRLRDWSLVFPFPTATNSDPLRLAPARQIPGPSRLGAPSFIGVTRRWASSHQHRIFGSSAQLCGRQASQTPLNIYHASPGF